MNPVFGLNSGDPKAFAVIFETYHQKVYYFHLRKVKDTVQAEELTQQTFIKLWQGRAAFSPDSSLDAFCFTIARSVLIDHFRRLAAERKRQQLITAYTVEEAEERSTSDFESADYLRAIVSKLPPVRRHVFLLKIVEGYSNREVAEQLSISVKTVEDHYSKAVRQLRSVSLALAAVIIISTPLC